MELFGFLKRQLTVVYLMTHPSVPLRLKTLPVVALVYTLFPRDVLLDFRAFGYLDDVLVAALLLSIFTARGWAHVLEAERAKREAIPVDFEVIDAAAEGDGAETAPGGPPHADIRS